MPMVRWVGDRDPVEVNRPQIVELIAAGKLTKEDVWAYNAKRQIVLPGVTVRLLGPSEGLSHHYQWGPALDSYAIPVTDADWTRIQALPEANTFVLVDS